MLRKIAATRSDDRATLWLLDTYRLFFVLVVLLMCLPFLELVPWWLFPTVLVASTFVTKIRFMRRDQGNVRVTVLWLGLVPIWKRQGFVEIGAGWEDDYDDGLDWRRGDPVYVPGATNEVTLAFRGEASWSFPSRRAKDTAEWLRQAQSAMRDVPDGGSADPTESTSRDDAAPRQ